jgi:hypothetical protein
MIFLLFLCCNSSQPPIGFEGISAERLKNRVSLLASDEYMGRGTGTQGLEKAASFIEKEFLNHGLVPLEGQTSLQIPYTLYQSGWNQKTQLSISGISSKVGVDWLPFSFSDDGIVSAEIVFAGYGITAPEYDYNDYKDLDVTNKIVLVIRREPNANDPNSIFNGTENTSHSYFATKAALAQKNGAVGMLLFTDSKHPNEDDFSFTKSFSLTQKEYNTETESTKPFLAAHISRNIAQKLLKDQGSLDQLQEVIDNEKQPSTIVITSDTVTLTVTRETKQIEVTNVVGRLVGGDPKLENEMVIVGAHYDHLGQRDNQKKDNIYNGADDNASGTSGLLEIMQAFATSKEKQNRTLVFAAFSAEEHGLLGSKVLVRDHLKPNSISFMLNLDMIGRNSDKPIEIIGDGYATNLDRIIEVSNDQVKLPIDLAGDRYFGASDHDSFYRHSIPFLFFFSGMHDDYHQLTDTFEKLDYKRMEEIVKLSFLISKHIANVEEPPSFIHHINWVGVSLLTQNEIVVLHKVTSKARGFTAGLEEGDQLLQLDEKEHTAQEWTTILDDIKPNQEIVITVQRGDLQIKIPIQRATKGFVGIRPQSVPEKEKVAAGLSEDEGIYIRSLVQDGPAEKAGFQQADIILQMNGEIVSLSNLGQILENNGAGEQVSCLILRDNLRQTIALTLGERTP